MNASKLLGTAFTKLQEAVSDEAASFGFKGRSFTIEFQPVGLLYLSSVYSVPERSPKDIPGMISKEVFISGD